MGKNNYLVVKEIAVDIRKNFEVEVPTSWVAEQIRERIGGDKATVTKYLKMLEEMGVTKVIHNVNTLTIIPAYTLKPMTEKNKQMVSGSAQTIQDENAVRDANGNKILS